MNHIKALAPYVKDYPPQLLDAGPWTMEPGEDGESWLVVRTATYREVYGQHAHPVKVFAEVLVDHLNELHVASQPVEDYCI
jgi:hypothetical protein